MEGTCNYCWLPVVSVVIVVAVERMSGPPFVQVACTTCMAKEGLTPWRSRLEIEHRLAS
jgi:hypothetical protein